MYCPRCKREVGETEFCENCGAATVGDLQFYKQEAAATAEIEMKIKKENPEDEVITLDDIKKKVAKISPTKIIAGAIALVLIIGVMIGSSSLKKYYSPEKSVERYVNSVLSSQYDKAYGMLDITESKFINKDYYKKYLVSFNLNGKQLKDVREVFGQQDINAEILKYMGGQGANSNQLTKDKQADRKMYEIQIGDNLFGAQVIKKGKIYGIFDNWKIVASDFTKRWQFTVPKGAEVFVDGVKVERVEKPNTVSGFSLSPNTFTIENQMFVVESIFPGEYEVTFKMDGAKDITRKAAAGDIQQQVKFEPTDELVTELSQLTQKFFDLYYSNADKSKFDGVVTPDSNFLKEISNPYYSSYTNYNNEKRKFDKLDIKGKSIEDMEHATLSGTAKVNYEREVTSWFFSTQTQKQTGTYDNQLNMRYIKKNGKWLIADPGYVR